MSESVNEGSRSPLQILVFSASRREDSLNTKLARLAERQLAERNVVVYWASISDFDCVSYDGDVEAESGIPGGAVALRDCLEACDGYVIASPEYNASMPGILKNVIDWTSRHRPQPFHQKHCLLMSASPSMVGGNRGLWSIRVPLEHLGSRVYPDMFSLAQAHNGFNDDGTLSYEPLNERFAQTLKDWVDLVEASKHYPCAKARWFEFLGEHPIGAVERAE